MSQAEYCMGGLPLYCEASMRWALALCNEAMCRASCRYCGTGEAFDNIYVERDIATWEDLDERLRRMEHFIQNPPGPPLRLVIIDSIAHLFSDSVNFQSGEARIGGIRVACIRASISMCMGTLRCSTAAVVVNSSPYLQAAMQSAQRSCSGWQGC